MLKMFALAGFAAAIALTPVSAFAVNGTSSSYGSTGYGPSTQSLTPFDRAWNHANQSKIQAREGAEYIRRHSTGGSYQHML